jgi:hypothetical protein
VLLLTLLAPEIAEALLDGRHDPDQITLERLLRALPTLWRDQHCNL